MKLFNSLMLVAALAPCGSSPALAEDAPTLILKYDFERADSVANWRQHIAKEAVPDKVAVDPSVSHSGQSALKFEIANNTDTPRHVYCGAKLPVQDDQPGRSVRLRLFARTANVPGGEVSVRILERDATKVIGWLENKETLLALESSPDWKEYEVSRKLSPSARGVTLYVFLKNPRAGQAVWLDDVSLEMLSK